MVSYFISYIIFQWIVTFKNVSIHYLKLHVYEKKSLLMNIFFGYIYFQIL